MEGAVKIDILDGQDRCRRIAQRPFWAARRVARKFPACGRELRRGGSADPEHSNTEGRRPPKAAGAQNERTSERMSFRFGRGG